MAKPKAIQWLEEQTGESIAYTPEEPTWQGRERAQHVTNHLGRSRGLHHQEVTPPTRARPGSMPRLL